MQSPSTTSAQTTLKDQSYDVKDSQSILYTTYGQYGTTLFGAINERAREITKTLNTATTKLNKLKSNQADLQGLFQSIINEVDESFDNMDHTLLNVGPMDSFGRGTPSQDPRGLILSPISMMYMARMLNHILPLADPSKEREFTIAYPDLVQLAGASEKYIAACVALQESDRNFHIDIHRALSLVASPGIGKSNWLHAAAYFAFALGVPVDTVEGNTGSYKLHSFEPDGTSLRHIPPTGLPDVDFCLQSEPFLTENREAVAEMKNAFHFVKSRLALGGKRLIIFDPVEYATGSSETTHTAHFATTISPLFHDSAFLLKPSTQHSAYTSLPSPFDDVHELNNSNKSNLGTTPQSRLISAHSCPKFFKASMTPDIKGTRFYCFTSTTQLMTPLPNIYTHNQISKIFTPEHCPSTSKALLPLIKHFCTPSIRPIIKFITLSPKELTALANQDFLFQINTRTNQHKNPRFLFQDISTDSAFPRGFFHNTFSTSYSYPEGKTVTDIPAYTQQILNAAVYDRFIDIGPKQVGFLKAVEHGILFQSEPHLYVQKKGSDKLFDEHAGEWFKIEHFDTNWTEVMKYSENQITTVWEDLFLQPRGTLIRFFPGLPSVDFCFKIGRGDKDHYHFFQIETTHDTTTTPSDQIKSLVDSLDEHMPSFYPSSSNPPNPSNPSIPQSFSYTFTDYLYSDNHPCQMISKLPLPETLTIHYHAFSQLLTPSGHQSSHLAALREAAIEIQLDQMKEVNK